MVIITGYYYGCGQSCLDTNSQIVPGKSIINNLQQHWSKSFVLMKFCISNLKVLEYGKEIGDGPSTQRSLVIFCSSEGRKIHLHRQSKRPGGRGETLQTHRIDKIYIKLVPTGFTYMSMNVRKFRHSSHCSIQRNYPYSLNTRWMNEFQQNLCALYMHFSGCKVLMIFMKIITVLKLVQSTLALSWTWCKSPEVRHTVLAESH